MSAQLITELGPTSSPVFLLPEGESVTIGRNPSNALVLLDSHVSRWHAQIVHRNGRYFLRDNHSVNGTRLGGRLIGCETPLLHNQIIRTGGVILRFQSWADEGQSFRPIRIDPNWLLVNDRAVFHIALAIIAEDQPELLPILADALEDAGCADADILAHCRATEEHRHPCWLLPLLVSLEGASTPKQHRGGSAITEVLSPGEVLAELPESEW